MADSVKNPPPPGKPPGIKTKRVQDPPPQKVQPKLRIG